MQPHILRILVAICLVGASPASAVDGVIELNDARALAGGVTPGDAPGYPVTLDQPGSYRLTGDLFASGADQTIVEIRADHVTLDLNGFSIRCLFILGTPCAGNGSGIGIDGIPAEYVTVRNGSVLDMGDHGLFLGRGSRISEVTALNNGGKGIRVGTESSVSRSAARGNGGTGIEAVGGSRIAENVVEGNGATGGVNDDDGVRCTGACVILDNMVQDSSGDGIRSDSSSTIRGNTVVSSGGHGINSLGGSTVIGNTIRGSARCGLRGGGETGYADNVLTFNNGTILTDNLAVIDAIEIGTNICGHDTDCTEGAANQCM